MRSSSVSMCEAVPQSGNIDMPDNVQEYARSTDIV